MLVTYSEAMGLMVAVDITTTILKLRAPGMTLRHMPLFVWASLVTSVMIIFAMPMVMLAANLVQFDRMLGTHFFNPAEGGDPLLWQHLFWFFGHPEVYFIFIPALGFISAVIPTFARRPMFGHDAIVLSLIATGFLSFGLWVHHMFATNVPELGKSFFTAMSFMIAIPTALQIFCWIATIASGRLVMRTPLLFVLGFFFILLIGGLTGIMLGSVPLDLQVHDTYFVVAHLHYVLIGGAVFPLFAAIYYWFPKITGRMLSDRLGQMAVLDLLHRRQPDVLSAAHSRPRGHAEAHLHLRPRDGLGLPELPLGGRPGDQRPQHVPVRVQRRTQSPQGRAGARRSLGRRHARMVGELAAARLQLLRVARRFVARAALDALQPDVTHVSGLSAEIREGLTTTVIDALPDTRYAYPAPEIWPFVAALAVTFWLVWSIWSVPGFAWGLIPPAIAFIAWYWPNKKESIEEVSWETEP